MRRVLGVSRECTTAVGAHHRRESRGECSDLSCQLGHESFTLCQPQGLKLMLPNSEHLDTPEDQI